MYALQIWTGVQSKKEMKLSKIDLLDNSKANDKEKEVVNNENIDSLGDCRDTENLLS